MTVRAFSVVKDRFGPLAFHALRGLERGFSPSSLYSALAPLAFARAATKQIESLPAVFRGSSSTRTLRQARLNYFLSRIPEFFPDRLATAKWRGRFKTTGFQHLEDARKRKGRVVLVCFHFGTYKLISFWLRALGVPVIAVIGGKSADRSRVKRMKDQLSPFPGMPTVLCIGDQLRKTVEHLSAGQVLLVAADRETNKQIDVRIDEQWSFSMATGAMRLAAHCKAELIPCSMRDEGRWNFRLEIGPPIPGEYLTNELDLQNAGQHLLRIMLLHLRRHPEDCASYLLDRFQSNAAPSPVEHSFA